MNNKLSSIYNLSLEFFEILKKEYNIYLSNSEIEFLTNIDIKKFYKVVKSKYLPSIYFIDNKYYINSYYDLENIESLIPFLCFRSLIKNINPLKIGLIEKELLYLKDKYNLNINTYFNKELEIAEIVSKTILSNIPFKVIFKENDIDIVNYLVEEYGSKIALAYYNVSKKMKEISNDQDYFNRKNNINYDEVKDYLYDFIVSKVK